MAYIHDHKILSGEEMMIGDVSAEVGLGSRLSGILNQRASRATAHGHTAHGNIRDMRAADNFEAEP